jgi:hypothetical protein
MQQEGCASNHCDMQKECLQGRNARLSDKKCFKDFNLLCKAESESESKQAIEKYINTSPPKSHISYVDLKSNSLEQTSSQDKLMKGFQCQKLTDGSSIRLSHIDTVDEKSFQSIDQNNLGNTKSTVDDTFVSCKVNKPEINTHKNSIKQEITAKKLRNVINRSSAKEKLGTHSKESTRKNYITANKLIPILPRQNPENVFFNGQLIGFQNGLPISGINVTKPAANQKESIRKRKLVANKIVFENEVSLVSKKPCPLQSIQTSYPIHYALINQPQHYTQHQPVISPLCIVQQGDEVQGVMSPQVPTSPIQNLSDLVAKLIPDVNSNLEQQSNAHLMGFIGEILV